MVDPYKDLARRPEVRDLIRMALREDLGSGDVTSLCMVDRDVPGQAVVAARSSLVVCGMDVAGAVFAEVDGAIQTRALVPEGARVEAGTAVMDLRGPAISLLSGERTALNFMQRLSGIASLTQAYVDAVAGTGVAILDTRKTTPGWRVLEKAAVFRGGGVNHRTGLYDQVLIKDNHLAHRRHRKGGGLAQAVLDARQAYPNLVVEVEADTLDQVREALPACPDWILLDNMTPSMLREAVALCREICKTEASGGINLTTVRAAAETGVDAISVGALTHSAPAVDLGLDWKEPT